MFTHILKCLGDVKSATATFAGDEYTGHAIGAGLILVILSVQFSTPRRIQTSARHRSFTC